ncbi:hypothetical protein KDL45_11870 [bacterium]|nr:hypothetical protein [bacterium]
MNLDLYTGHFPMLDYYWRKTTLAEPNRRFFGVGFLLLAILRLGWGLYLHIFLMALFLKTAHGQIPFPTAIKWHLISYATVPLVLAGIAFAFIVRGFTRRYFTLIGLAFLTASVVHPMVFYGSGAPFIPPRLLTPWLDLGLVAAFIAAKGAWPIWSKPPLLADDTAEQTAS